jgi:hypothetical protein
MVLVRTTLPRRGWILHDADRVVQGFTAAEVTRQAASVLQARGAVLDAYAAAGMVTRR